MTWWCFGDVLVMCWWCFGYVLEMFFKLIWDMFGIISFFFLKQLIYSFILFLYLCLFYILYILGVGGMGRSPLNPPTPPGSTSCEIPSGIPPPVPPLGEHDRYMGGGSEIHLGLPPWAPILQRKYNLWAIHIPRIMVWHTFVNFKWIFAPGGRLSYKINGFLPPEGD